MDVSSNIGGTETSTASASQVKPTADSSGKRKHLILVLAGAVIIAVLAAILFASGVFNGNKATMPNSALNGSTTTAVAAVNATNSAAVRLNGTLYVVNQYGYSSGNLVALNLSSGKATSSVNSGTISFYNPSHIAVYGNTAYIVNRQGGSPLTHNGNITIMDLATNAIIGSINSAAFDAPTGISTYGSTAYVLNVFGGPAGYGNVIIINLTTDKVVGSINSTANVLFNNPMYAASSGTTEYVVNEQGGLPIDGTTGGNITILNTATGTVTGSINSNLFFGLAGIAISGNTVYVVNHQLSLNTSGSRMSTGSILLINMQSNQVVGSISSNAFGVPAGIAISGNIAYVLNQRGNFGNNGSNVLIINLTTRQVTGSINYTEFTDAYPVSITVSGTLAYIVNREGGEYMNGNIIIINLTDGKIAGSIDSPAIDFYLDTPGVAISGNTAYIANSAGGTTGTGNILVVNLSNDQIAGSINSGGFATPEAITPAGSNLYALNQYGGAYNTGNVVIINLTNSKITGAISAGTGFNWPSDIAVSGTTAYVTDPADTGVLIVNLTTKKITGSISSNVFAVPEGIAISDNTAYIADRFGGVYDNGTIVIVNLTTDKVVGSINSSAFDWPSDIAIRGTKAYVINQGSNSTAASAGNIVIINLTDNQIIGSINSEEFYAPAGIFIRGTTAYVTNPSSSLYKTGAILLVNLTNDSMVGSLGSRIGFDNPAGIALSGSTVYVVNHSNPVILEIDSADGKITGSISSSAFAGRPYANAPTGDSYGIAISGSTAYVTNPNGGLSNSSNGFSSYPSPAENQFGNVIIVNISTGQVTGSIESSSFYYPTGIAVSGNLAFVVNSYTDFGDGIAYASAGGGRITIINLTDYKVVRSINSSMFYNPVGIAISGSTAYVANVKGGTNGKGDVLIINTKTGQVTGSIESNLFYYPLGITVLGSDAFVTNNAGQQLGNVGNILIINLTTDKVVGSINSTALSSPIGITAI